MNERKRQESAAAAVLRPVALLLACAALASCLPIVEVKSRTTVLADGSVLRETTITKIRRDANDDREKELNARPVAEDLGAGIGEGFASRSVTDDEVRLRGVFADAASMPPDFRRDVPEVDSTSHNRAVLAREDLLLGTRFVWRECYVDAIQPDTQAEARRELVRFVTRFAKATLRHEFAERYDVARLEGWVDEEFTKLVDDVVGIFWDERRRLNERDLLRGETGLDRAKRKLLRRLDRFGLELPDHDELEAPENLLVLRTFLTDLLALKLRMKHDGPSPKPQDFHYLFAGDDPFTGIRLMIERAAERDYGGTKAAQEALQRHFLAASGTYGSPPAGAEYRFECAVEMPGLLLRTNGYLAGDREAFWIFSGDELYPHGRELEIESVVPDDSMIGRIRELRASFDRRDAAHLIAALENTDAEDRARLRETLRLCASQGTLAIEPRDEAEKKRLQRLATILKPQ